MKLELGDAFELIKTLEDNSVDLILTDPPYGITACAWDKDIDWDTLGAEFKRVLKPDGVCVIFSDFKLAANLYHTQPFTNWWSHQIVWNKLRTSNQLNAKRRPLQCHEYINIYNKGKVVYNPQYFYGWNKKKEWVFQKPTDPKDFLPQQSPSGYDYKNPKSDNVYHQLPKSPRTNQGKTGSKTNPLFVFGKDRDNEIVSEPFKHSPPTGKGPPSPLRNKYLTGTDYEIVEKPKNVGTVLKPTGQGTYNEMASQDIPMVYTDPGYRYPTTIAPFQKRIGKALHPTEKPVHLLEWLIKSYSNESAVILDCFMGSGSTGEACINTGREFIGFELNEDYFNSAKERLSFEKT